MLADTGGSHLGRVAVVTGGATGIGLAVSEALTGLGMIVVALGRDQARLEAGLAGLAAARPGQVEAIQASVCDEDRIESAFAEVIRRHGRLDVVVSNAGVSARRRVPLVETTTEEWRLMVETNLTGTYFVARAAVPRLEAHGGYLITILSLAAHRVRPGSGIYAASKYGARALTEALIEELRGGSVRVSAISPGPVDSGVWDLQVPPPAAEVRAFMLRPADVAGAVTWLLAQPENVHVPEIRIAPWRSPAA